MYAKIEYELLQNASARVCVRVMCIVNKPAVPASDVDYCSLQPLFEFLFLINCLCYL